MFIDWVTWSIWLVGFAIMITWIMVPLAEFKKLLKKKGEERRAAGEDQTKRQSVERPAD